MKHKCPYCGGAIDAPPITYSLTKKQGDLYAKIVLSGQKGAPKEEIMASLYKGRSEISMRTAIASINKIIKPQKLVGSKGVYRLECE